MLVRLLILAVLMLSCRISMAEEPKPKVGTLKGTVRVKGDVPSRPPLVTKGDEATRDAAVCAAVDIPDESLVVNVKEKNGLANVGIWMKAAPDGFVAEPVGKAKFRAKGCRFEPHVLAVRANQKIEVHYEDPIAHTLHGSPFRSKQFSAVFTAHSPVSVVWDKAERAPIKIKCDLHTWMSAYHIVTDHPFVAISDVKGTFEIENMPAGSHEFVIWHERVGWLEKSKTIEIKPDETTTLDLEYDAKTFK